MVGKPFLLYWGILFVSFLSAKAIFCPRHSRGLTLVNQHKSHLAIMQGGSLFLHGRQPRVPDTFNQRTVLSDSGWNHERGGYLWLTIRWIMDSIKPLCSVFQQNWQLIKTLIIARLCYSIKAFQTDSFLEAADEHTPPTSPCLMVIPPEEDVLEKKHPHRPGRWIS